MALQELNRAHIALRCILEWLGRGLHMEGQLTQTVPTHGPVRGGIPIERDRLRWAAALFVAYFVTPTGQLKPSASCSAVAHVGGRRSFASGG